MGARGQGPGAGGLWLASLAGNQKRSQLWGLIFGFSWFRGSLQRVEGFDGLFVGLFGGIDLAVEPLEDGGCFGVGLAEFDARFLLAEAGLVNPQLGFDAVVAAEEPFTADELIDLEALLGSGGGELPDVFGLEFGELLGDSPGTICDWASSPDLRTR